MPTRRMKPRLFRFLHLGLFTILLLVAADRWSVEVREGLPADVNGAGRQSVFGSLTSFPDVDLEPRKKLDRDPSRTPRLPPRQGEKRKPVLQPSEPSSGIQILLAGSENFSEREILEAIDLPQDAQVPQLKATVEGSIRGFYRRQGFVRAKVRASTSSLTPDLLEVSVQEGERYVFGGLEFTGSAALSLRDVKRFYPTVGAFIDWSELRQGDTRLKEEYRERGFPNVKLTSTARIESSNRRLTYRIRVSDGPYSSSELTASSRRPSGRNLAQLAETSDPGPGPMYRSSSLGHEESR